MHAACHTTFSSWWNCRLLKKRILQLVLEQNNNILEYGGHQFTSNNLNTSNSGQINEVFSNYLLKERNVKLTPPRLVLTLGETYGEKEDEKNKQENTLYLTYMALQTAYWFGLITKDGLIGTTEKEIKIIFSYNYEVEPAKFEFLKGIDDQQQQEYNSGSGNVRFSNPINRIIRPFRWAGSEGYKVVSEIKDEDTNLKEVNQKSVDIAIEPRTGIEFTFLVDFSNILEMIGKYFSIDNNKDIMPPLWVSTEQIPNTYDRTNQAENVGIFMGLSMLDAILDETMCAALQINKNHFRLHPKSFKKDERRADYETGKDERDIVVENKCRNNKNTIPNSGPCLEEANRCSAL